VELVIDGHNLMFFASRRNKRFAVERGEAARDELLGLLARYQKVKGGRVVCVFDGGLAGAHLPRRSMGVGVEVVYSPPESDADTEIKAMVARHAAPREVRVITSDNAIRAFVEKVGAAVSRSHDFLEEVDETLTDDTLPSDEPIEKYEGPSDDEADFWMGVFGGEDEESK